MEESLKTVATGWSQSKIILFGEHGVVYGKPAIAMPFPLNVNVTLTRAPLEHWIESTFYNGPLAKVPTILRGYEACLYAILEELSESETFFHIKIQSDIPVGKGLGASAAIAIALVRGVYNFFDLELEEERLLRWVHLAECHAHGTPSGIDMTAEISQGPIWFNTREHVVPIDMDNPLFLVVADTGILGRTKEAVGHVRSRYEAGDRVTIEAVESIGQLVDRARSVLGHKNLELLGHLMDENQRLLSRLGVSSKELDDLIRIAKRAGALGAKLTGGGMGGCIIALAKNRTSQERIVEAFREQGADQVWVYTP